MAETAKYYLRAMDECDPWNVYYSEEQASEDKLYVSTEYPWESGYSRNEMAINVEDLRDVVEGIETALEEIDYSFYGIDEDTLDEEEIANTILDTIKYYLPYANKLSKGNLNQLIEFCFQYKDDSHNEEILKVFLQILEIIYGEPFISGTFHGYSQGDWAIYICPKKLEPQLGFIEACIMGTGTEFAVSEIPLAGPEDFDDVDWYYEYTELWKDDDIKKWAADNLGCSPNDVEIIKKD